MEEPRGTGPKRNGGKPHGLANEGRNGEIYRAVMIYRRTQQDVAEEFGITQQRVSAIVQQVRDAMPEDERDEMRRATLELYDEITRRVLEVADLVPAPLVAGKDGLPVQDPVTGEFVRDYSARLKALELALKPAAERRKLMGLDAAEKLETTGTVRFELVGVDVEDLS